jgi:predicted heme/steroid binding protein
MFTKTELAKFDGKHGAPTYLALLGHVFDVSRKAGEFYSKGVKPST